MPRHPLPLRTAPKVDKVYEVAVAHLFLDAGYDLVRLRDGTLVMARGEHRVPVYTTVALHFEARHPSLIQSEP